jgi:FlaA1/EpsC-like NDP-sugar epimerase
MNMLNKLINWYFSKNAFPYWIVFILDCFICYFAGIIVFWMYYHGAVTLGNIALLSKTIAMYMCFNLIGFRIFKTYTGIIRYSSFVDLQRVAMAMGVSLVIAEIMHYVVYGWDLRFVRLEGRQIAAMYVIATLGMWGYRIIVKTIYDVMFSSKKGKRALIYGINNGGVGLAKNIRNEKPSRFQLKGFVADDEKARGHILFGVKTYSIKELEEVINGMNINAFLVSPLLSKSFQEDGELQDLLINNGVQIYMAPLARAWQPGDDFSNVELKPISIEDLLPRDEIKVDMEAVGKMLTDKKVVITGSAGSIGSEMVRQIANFKPAYMILIDQAETPQHDIRLMMAKQYADIRSAKTIVATIENRERMEHIFMAYRPDYVFHAAAYKHVPMMENNPSESIQNNILGTKNIADLSVKYGVKKFVMISTDKAVNPTNVMGCSKRICEIYVQSLNKTENTTQFVTTRFGNVLGSNGSVIPLFEQQIKEGGPVTVTDPNIIRFFMLIPEACKLVLEAGTQGNGGQIFVFDMGKPVKIADLAKRMIMLSGAKNVEIKYTGLRAGEKLYEEVLSNAENSLPSFNEKIRIAKVREYDFKEISQQIDELIEISHSYDDMAIVKKMKEIVPEYHPNNSVFTVLDD